ncbi:MAG TPA: DUF6089 family protein [Ohtaekwangia sp.]
MNKHRLLIIFFAFFLTLQAFGQSFYALKRERKFIVFGGLNTSTYYGDLKDKKDILDIKPSVTIGGQYYFTNRIGARAEFSWVTLSGADEDSDDEGKIKRNLSFKSSNYEVAVSGIVNLLPHGRRFYQRPPFNAYGFIGVGVLFFNPKAEQEGKTYVLHDYQTEGVDYSRTSFIIPYGIGGRVQVNPFFNVCVELGWRKTFTDYIDDVSTVYLDNASFTDDRARKLADRRWELEPPLEPLEAGKKRGDPSNDDAYMLMSVKVEYYLPYEILGFQQRKLYKSKRKAYYKRRRR